MSLKWRATLRRHTFTEDFEDHGVFWLPDKPEEHVPGTVSCSAEGIKLHLFGLLYEGEKFEERDRKPSFILGRLRQGNLVTLYRTIEREISVPSGASAVDTIPPWPHNCSFVAHHMFLGAHFQSEDEIRFTEVGMSLTYLEEWMGAKGRAIETDIPDVHDRTQTATYTPRNRST
jgi:ApeA N-terminal domain 1